MSNDLITSGHLRSLVDQSPAAHASSIRASSNGAIQAVFLFVKKGGTYRLTLALACRGKWYLVQDKHIRDALQELSGCALQDAAKALKFLKTGGLHPSLDRVASIMASSLKIAASIRSTRKSAGDA